MYTHEQLKKYPFFESLINRTDISYILDSLTKTITRQCFIDFVNDLVNHNTPFLMGIIDLDNFKLINDNYGHLIGDQVLKAVATDISNYIGDDGLVGRYGGDEFIFIYTKSNDYNDIHDFLEKMYDQGILRKNILLGHCNPFITATIGCATYPNDAKSFKELFELADKTLYRGKIKGRNCFIIYVEAKHKNITVQKLAKEDLYITLYNLANAFETPSAFDDKLKNTFLYLTDVLKISYLYYIDKTGAIKDVRDGSIIKLKSDDLRKSLGDDALYTSNFTTDTTPKDDEIKAALSFLDMYSLLIARIEKNNHFYGYIMITEKTNTRIWQHEEKAIIFYFSKMIAAYLEYKK